MPTLTQSEARLQSLVDERETTRQLHESVVGAIDGSPTDSQAEQIQLYREKTLALDGEIDMLSEQVEKDRKAAEVSRKIRKQLAGSVDGVDVDDEGIAYRTMAAFARDVILTRDSSICSQIAKRAGDDSLVQAARERIELIKRTPANTLSSNVGGLQPDQHINQIFQVIDKSRPLVSSAGRSTLERGTLTDPVVTTRPVVSVQASEKTEAGNQGMVVDMETTTASTYLGGGDLSWQAINWSTPDALQLWFDLAAADYALKTEQDASQALQHSGFTYDIGTTLGATPTYAQFLTAIAAGASDVWTNSSRMANTIYMAPDRYWYLFGLTSDSPAQFTTVSLEGIGPLRVIPSRGMDSGVIVVGDSSALLVAETAGAPVELRVVEPAIGGVEVGLIGAFEAVVVDDGAFSMITTAS